MIRATYITLDKKDGTFIHMFSVFEQMMPEMQDAGDVGNRNLLPSDARPTGHSPSKDNLTFHARLLPETTRWEDVVANPLQYIDVDGKQVEYLPEADIQAVECDCASLFDFHHTAKSTLTAVLPFRKSGGKISRYFDVSSKVSETVLKTNLLRKHLQNLSMRFLGYDLTQYPEHIGNVHLIRWNPLFRDVSNWIDQGTGNVHVHIQYYGNNRPGIIVRATGQNKSGALLFDQELCRVNGQKYTVAALPTIPNILTLRYYDSDNNLWMECSTTGRPLSIQVGTMMVGNINSIETENRRGKKPIVS